MGNVFNCLMKERVIYIELPEITDDCYDYENNITKDQKHNPN